MPSLTEHVVLGLLVDGPTHGFGLARRLAPGGDVGRAVHVARSAVYRALDRLVEEGLAAAVGEQPGDQAPARTLVAATDEGRAAHAAWVCAPVGHVRDLRLELMAKLALLHARGADADPLVVAQVAVLERVVERRRGEVAEAAGFDRTLALWRLTTAEAGLAFVTGLRDGD